MASALEAGFLRFVIGHGGRSNAPADLDDRRVGFGRVHSQLTNGLNKVDELPALHHKALAADWPRVESSRVVPMQVVAALSGKMRE